MDTQHNTHVPVAAPLADVTTERLRLRQMRASDADALASVFARPEVWRYPYGRGLTTVETEAFLDRQLEHWAVAGFGLWLAIERATSRTVGFVGLSTPTFLPAILPAVEVGWRLDPSVWGCGYATEAATAALTEGFSTLGLEEICSVPQADNAASVRVAERLGMRFIDWVDIPATAQRGALRGSLFRVTHAEWQAQP